MIKNCFKFLMLIIIIGAGMIIRYLPVYGDETTENKIYYVKAEIYYYGWDVLTRQRLTPEAVRKGYKIRTSITDPTEVAKLVSWLELNKMKKSIIKDAEDARLTIDLFTATGIRATYYASRFSLLTEDSSFKRSINEIFRDKFHF